MAIMIEEMQAEGLLDGHSVLTSKGRTWLRTLEDLETQEIVQSGEEAADLVLSTNGLFR